MCQCERGRRKAVEERPLFLRLRHVVNLIQGQHGMAQEREALEAATAQAQESRRYLLAAEAAAVQDQYLSLKMLRYIAAALGLTVAVLGGLGLVGNLASNWILASFHEGYKIMVPAVGLALALCGAAALCVAIPRCAPERVVRVLAFLVLTIAALRLAELAVGVDYNSSNLFIPPPWMPLSPDETPAALPTVAALLAAALGFLLMRRHTRPVLLFSLASIPTVVGAAFLLGYVYGNPMLYGTRLIPIAVPAALGLTLLGIAMMILLAARELALRMLMTIRGAEDQAERAHSLERERKLKDDLQTANEDLAAANEELQASNEELQGTNKKLNTAAHDLEAVNAQLVERAAELQAIIGTVADGVVVFDLADVPITMNAAGEALLGLSPEERRLPPAERVKLRHVRRADGTPLPPEELPSYRALHGEAVSGQVMIRRTPVGEDIWVSESAASLLDSQGQITGAVVAVTDITTLVQGQKELEAQRDEAQRRMRVVEGINGILDRVIGSQTEEELGRTCLDAAETLTESAFGFIGEIGPDGLLHDLALSDPGWNYCTMYDQTGHRRPPGNFLIHGLYGRVLSDGRSLIANDPYAHPDSLGTPEGHPVLTAFLGVPLIHQGQTIGMIAVANRPGGYRLQDQETLEALAPVMVEALHRKRAEEELARYRDHLEDLVTQRTAEVQERSRVLESVFNNSLSSLVLLDTEFNFLRVNETYAAACGRPAEDFSGHNHFVDYPSDELKATFKEVVRTKTPWNISARPFEFPDHPEWSVTYWDLSLVPILDAAGEVEVLLFSLQDVSERVRAQQERERLAADVARSERKFRELVQSANSAIIQWDGHGTITLTNAYAERLFGYEHGELLGQDVMILAPEVEAGTGRSLEGLKDAILANPEAFQTNENENITKDGRRLWMLWANRVVLDGHNDFEGVMAIGIDRTAQHEAEKALEEHQQRLRALAAEVASAEQRERQRLATTIHDGVAQTVGGLKMRLQMLNARPEAALVAAELGEATLLADEALREARSVITDLNPPILRQFGLIETLRWWGAQVSEKRGLEVTIRPECGMEQVEYDVQVILFQTVKELLQNTVKYAEATQATITVRGDESHLKIEVTDDGVGFDPTSARYTEEGGFGLFNARERMMYLGGDLQVDSAPGKGTRATISLPLPCVVSAK